MAEVVVRRNLNPYHEPRFQKEVDCRIVDDGFHSHADIAEAEDECRDGGFPATTILRCEIPKGAYYYKSSDSDGRYMQYCSDRLRIDAQLVKGKWVTEFPGGSE